MQARVPGSIPLALQDEVEQWTSYVSNSNGYLKTSTNAL